MRDPESSQLPIRTSRLQPAPVAQTLPQPDRFSQAGILRSQVGRALAVLSKRWWIPVLCLVFIAGPAAVYSARQAPTFRSKATLWFSGKLNLPEGRLIAEELSSYLGTQVELLKSAPVRQEALTGLTGAGLKDLRAKRFNLEARSSLKSSTVELRGTGPSAELAKAFVDEVMSAYTRFKKDARGKASSQALSTITDQLKQLEAEIRTKEQALHSFEAANNLAFLRETSAAAGGQMARLMGLLSDLRTERRLLEILTPAQFRDLGQRPAGVGGDVTVPGQAASQGLTSHSSAGQSTYYQALQQLGLLKARRKELESVLRPTHSKMVKLNQEISGFEQLLETLRTEGEEQARTQMMNRRRSLELQIENLEAQYATWQTNAVESTQKLAVYDGLKEELQRSNALYDRLLGLVQTVDISKGLDQEALTPVAPASPGRQTLDRFKVAAAGLLSALVASIALLLVVATADDRFNSATELSLHLPEEILGQIPKSAAVHGSGKKLLKHPEELQAFAESFRNLRSCLLCMAELPPGPKTIMVTSASPKEGKTTVTANLGRALAVSGFRVLLVDADLRRSSLHKALRLEVERGLREVLIDRVPVDEVILDTGERNLRLLAAGRTGNTGSEIFLGAGAEQLFARLEAHYDYVLIDSAPVLATDDAGTLGPLTKGVFFVVRHSYTSSRMLREALARLHRRRIRVLGIVYNCAAAKDDYYYRYGKDYSSAESKEVGSDHHS